MNNINIKQISLQKALFTFSQAVKQKEYKKIEYSKWRRLIKYSEEKDFVLLCYNPTDTHISIRKVINELNPNTESDEVIEVFPCDDNSFGQFLYEKFCPRIKVDFESAPIKVGFEGPPIIHDYTPLNTPTTLYCNSITSTAEINNIKEGKGNKMFNFDFGPVDSNNFSFSPYGLAVRTKNNGWVSFDFTNNNLMDVEILNFNIDNFIYKMPVALSNIKRGDILMHSKFPVFVLEAPAADGTVKAISAIDATIVTILPVKNMFNFNFYTKICSLVDFTKTAGTPSPENPFGNMLPFFLMANSKNNNIDPMVFLFLGNDNGLDVSSNPMMLYFLLNNKEDNRDMLPFLLMMNQK